MEGAGREVSRRGDGADLAGETGPVAGQILKQGAVGMALEHPDETADARLGQLGLGDAEIEAFLPQRPEGEAGLLGAEADADTRIGPTGPHGAGDAGMAADDVSDGCAVGSEHGIKAIAGRRAGLAQRPAVTAAQQGVGGVGAAADGKGEAFLPLGGADQGVAGSEGIAGDCDVAIGIVGGGKMQPGEVDQTALEEIQRVQTAALQYE